VDYVGLFIRGGVGCCGSIGFEEGGNGGSGLGDVGGLKQAIRVSIKFGEVSAGVGAWISAIRTHSVRLQ
jgi:hypothetical protein